MQNTQSCTYMDAWSYWIILVFRLVRQMHHLAWVSRITARAHIWNCRGRRCTAMWSLRLMRRKKRLWLKRLEVQLRAMMILLHLCLRMIADMQCMTMTLWRLRTARRAKYFSLPGQFFVSDALISLFCCHDIILEAIMHSWASRLLILL